MRLEGVGVTLGDNQILRGINLNISAGQTLVVIGESGCGKSVFLKLLIGLVKATEGRILFQDQDLKLLSENRLMKLRLKYGYLFQSGALFDSLSVEENVAFPMRQQGIHSETAIRQRVGESLEDVGLPPSLWTRMPSDLSGGQRKRVGLARALVMQPAIMLYDEPTTGLDPIMTGVINDLILKVARSRPVTSVVVTHELRTLATVADRVLMLRPLPRLEPWEPQVAFEGTPSELRQCGLPVVKSFLGGHGIAEITAGGDSSFPDLTHQAEHSHE
ncbi:MAG: ATP-binding cassette domain-containing protein [Planctomycetes bacterium]|jgi:phospholipid/cholesterol/gamma-HCH transport system ATP-binding protein|nr:ATP-binding cassette domain-containing protein [Planctomycetota bacterium]